jgi:peptidyl-prolyl cis-trans isomerase-like 2
MEVAPVDSSTNRPVTDIRITDVTIYFDPFEEFMNKQETKTGGSAQLQKKKDEKSDNIDDDLVTWTGKRVRGLDGSKASDAKDGGGVGKYLRAALAEQQTRKPGDEDEIIEFVDDAEPDPPEHARKKFKSKGGFGNFEGW